ncbi:MAG: ABC transporter substrate-binding protein [Acidobacteriota bacterium]
MVIRHLIARIACCLSLVLFVALVAGCLPVTPSTSRVQTSGGSAALTRTVTDTSGRQLVLPAKPQRIVSQTLATDEILLALVAPERLVALSHLADDERYSYCADRAKLVVGRCGGSAEAILQLHPDLIFVASYSRAELVELLSAGGAPVYRLTKFGGLADIKANIRAIGEAIGEAAAAEALVARMDRRFAAISERARQRGRSPRVVSFGESHLTAGTETTFDDLVRAVGGINIAAEQGVVGFRQISSEQLLAWQPDLIVVGAEAGKEAAVRQRWLADPAVAAAINRDPKRLVVVESRAMTTVSQHLADAAEHLEAQLFPSIDHP